MKILTLLLTLFISSCAKISYMTEQSLGQVKLELKGRNNKSILNDNSVSNTHKEKIKLVQKAKTFFFEYFNLKPDAIYNQTTFLDQDAVTYLVIHSPKNQIKALKTCFPILGCFPYLGFFNKESAKSFKSEKELEGYATYMRPVYAYSTLNHPMLPFSDNILSSFFHYNDYDLVGLIFHELVHTIVFVKNNVEFNENLAEFVSRELQKEYFKNKADLILKNKQKDQDSEKIRRVVSQLSLELESAYKKGKNNPQYVLENFNRNIFIPSITKLCYTEKIKKCWPLKYKWNNAMFAAYKTYQSKQSEIEEIYQNSNKNLREFVSTVIDLEKEHDSEKNFLDILKKESK